MCALDVKGQEFPQSHGGLDALAAEETAGAKGQEGMLNVAGWLGGATGGHGMPLSTSGETALTTHDLKAYWDSKA